MTAKREWTLWYCPECDYGTTAPTDDHRCPRCRVVYPETLRVAPVNQPPGAVEALRELGEMTLPMPPFNPVRVRVREALEALGIEPPHAGGQ